jgi:large conductance mechanosensitive channel protein
MFRRKAVTKEEMLKRVEAAKEQLDKIPTPHIKSHMAGFMNFVREQGVVGLAVGLVLGTQVKTVVDQLVISFITPLLGLLLPGQGDLIHKSFTVSMNGKQADFVYGAFVSVLISFLIVAALVYFLVKGLKLGSLDKKKDA